VNLDLPGEAVEFGAAAEKAFVSAGGVDLARRAESEPRLRAGVVAGVLDGLGIADLDPRADLDAAAASGELCRAAGRSALPYPLVAVLLGRSVGGSVGGSVPLALVPAERLRVDHGDLFEEWRVLDPDGRASTARWVSNSAADGSRARPVSKLGPFVVDLSADSGTDAPSGLDVNLHLTLTAWRILGTVERALELAVAHVRGREQFGQPLAAFQAVQFQLADAAVGVDGLRELCRFSLWRVSTDRTDPMSARPDALAVRLHALEVTRAVLRTCQQVHGAAGVCDEYDISILYRHVQPDLRLPFGAARAAQELVGAVAASGFQSLFPHGGPGS
jgi:hypothetical protein